MKFTKEFEGLRRIAFALVMDQGMGADAAEKISKRDYDLRDFKMKDLRMVNKFVLSLNTDQFDEAVLNPHEMDESMAVLLNKKIGGMKNWEVFMAVADTIFEDVGA